MIDLKPSSVYELVIAACGLIGLFPSVSLLRVDWNNLCRIKKKGINGEMLAAARECVWWAALPVFVHAALAYTCTWRVLHPMEGHFLPSTMRLILVFFTVTIVFKVKANRNKYPRKPEAIVEMTEIAKEQTAVPMSGEGLVFPPAIAPPTENTEEKFFDKGA